MSLTLISEEIDMKSSLKVSLTALLAVGMVVLAVAVTANKWPRTANSTSGSAQKRDDPVTDTLPPVVSLITGIQIINTAIDAQRQANITVVNNTGKDIVGLSLCSGNMTFSDDNGISQAEPRSLIPAGGSYTFQQAISNLKVHEPIRICAALYQDGSEEGEARVRKNIHDERDRQRLSRAHNPTEKR
jgi:hypothetical protein